jgi:hypothetical protein
MSVASYNFARNHLNLQFGGNPKFLVSCILSWFGFFVANTSRRLQHSQGDAYTFGRCISIPQIHGVPIFLPWFWFQHLWRQFGKISIIIMVVKRAPSFPTSQMCWLAFNGGMKSGWRTSLLLEERHPYWAYPGRSSLSFGGVYMLQLMGLVPVYFFLAFLMRGSFISGMGLYVPL